MKKSLLFLISILFIISCDKDESEDDNNPTNEYSIVGDWLIDSFYTIYNTPPYRVDETFETEEDKKCADEKTKFSFDAQGNYVFVSSDINDNKYCYIDEEEFGSYTFEKTEDEYKLTLIRIKIIKHHDQGRTIFYDNDKGFTVVVEFSEKGNTMTWIWSENLCGGERHQEPCKEHVVLKRKQ